MLVPAKSRSWLASLHNHRPIAALVSVPFLLVFIIWLLAPAATPRAVRRPGIGRAGKMLGITSPTPKRYMVVIDAGSTATRSHCFRFAQREGHGLEFIGDTFHHVKPGLSAFRNAPQDAAQSLDPLIDSAMHCVPPHKKGKTALELKATAGLRALPQKESEGIIEAVRTKLQSLPFERTSVEVLDGLSEGSFQWVAVNYLLGNLGGKDGSGKGKETVGVVDLGGASVQVAFELSPEEAQKAPSGYVRTLAGRSVYVATWSSFGLQSARAKVLEQAEDSSLCFGPARQGSLHHLGETHAYKGSYVSGARNCNEQVNSILRPSDRCELNEGCAFAGKWGGGRERVRKWALTSYLFDVAARAKIVADANAASHEGTIGDLRNAAESVCGKSEPSGLALAGLGTLDLDMLCLDLSYAYALLHSGLKVDDTKDVTFLNQVLYHGQRIEAAWPLGAAVSSLLSV